MQTLRFGDTFVAKYPGNLRYGCLYVIARDRANRGRPVLMTVNPSVELHVTDAPTFGDGDRFEAEADLFRVGTTEGFALAIDRIDLDSPTFTTPAA